MPDIPANQRSWWRQPPLWVGALPLLIFLLVSAFDLALAKQFTDNGKAVISDALGGVWQWMVVLLFLIALILACLLYTSPSPRDKRQSRMPSSA